MTLCGSFSELPLAEILQLATNSGNTGVLEINSDRGSAWIGIADGEVVRIARSDVSLSGDGQTLISAKQALLEIFEWRDGEFELDTFVDPRKSWKGPAGIDFDPPLNPQALSLEAARLHDERRRSGERRTTLTGSGSELPMAEVVTVAMVSGNTSVLRVWSSRGSVWIGLEAGEVVRLARTGDPEQAGSCARSEATKTLVEVFDWSEGGYELDVFAKPDESWGGPEAISLDPPLSHDEIVRAVARNRKRDAQSSPPTAERSAPTRAEPVVEREQATSPTQACAVIAISTDLQFLEDLRLAVTDDRMRIHCHQIPEDGIRRVGHYLVKGAVPLVVLDSQREESGGPSWPSVVARIRALSARICIVEATRERLRTALLPFFEARSPEAQRNIASVSES